MSPAISQASLNRCFSSSSSFSKPGARHCAITALLFSSVLPGWLATSLRLTAAVQTAEHGARSWHHALRKAIGSRTESAASLPYSRLPVGLPISLIEQCTSLSVTGAPPEIHQDHRLTTSCTSTTAEESCKAAGDSAWSMRLPSDQHMRMQRPAIELVVRQCPQTGG